MPNLLWICTDSQRWDTLGCLGNTLVRTPNADRLAAEGVLFRQAYAVSPVCTPSRAAFLTGRYPITARLRQNGQVAPDDLRLLPKILADAGWVNGLIGKLHLNACDNRLLQGPEWWRNDPTTFFRGTEPRVDDGYHEFLWDHAPLHPTQASAYQTWLHQRGRGPYPHPESPRCHWVQDGPPSDDHQTTWCFEQAISFVQRHAGKHYPWSLALNCFAPHYPFSPPPEFLDQWADRVTSITVPDGAGDLLAFQEEIRTKGKHYAVTAMQDGDQRWIRAAYWAQCEHIDVQLGRLLEALDASGQRESTIVAFHSDHGELLGHHRLYTKGPFLFDPAVHVPLILRGPGLPVGRISDDLVELVDLMPTFLDLCGLPIPLGVQGRSLVPILAGKAPARDDVLIEYSNAMPGKVYGTALRTATHKLIRWHSAPGGELYDLTIDPGETVNRWHDPAFQAVKIDLLERLSDRMAQWADPGLPRIGVY